MGVLVVDEELPDPREQADPESPFQLVQKGQDLWLFQFPGSLAEPQNEFADDCLPCVGHIAIPKVLREENG